MVDFKPDEELETQEFDAVDADTSGRQVPEWVKTIGKVLAVLVLVVLLVLGGRWLHHQLANKTTDKPAPTTTQQKPSASNGLSVNGGAKSGSGNGANGGSTQQNNPPVGTGKTSSENLPNTGPGDVIALFVGSSLAAAALHYAYSQRKLNA